MRLKTASLAHVFVIVRRRRTRTQGHRLRPMASRGVCVEYRQHSDGVLSGPQNRRVSAPLTFYLSRETPKSPFLL